MTRADLRMLIRRGLATAAGSYRRLLPVFRIERQDYKRLLNFLAAHDCVVDHPGVQRGRAADRPCRPFLVRRREGSLAIDR